MIFDGGTYAQAGDSRSGMLSETMHTHHINTRACGAAWRDTQVQCRKSQGTAEFLAVNHVSADLKGASQEILGAIQVADSQGSPDF
ncbi:hypothetical protein BOTU111922_20590 [Bordetella tumulicola]